MAYAHAGSSGQHCVVFGCNYNQRKRKIAALSFCSEHNIQQEKCGCNMFILHRFPADGDLRRQWVSAVNRQGFSPTEAARVCSRHFVDGKRTEENPVPMLALGYHRKVRAFCLSPCAYLLCVRQPSTLKQFTRYEAARWLSGPRR